jgi:A/G-specific adenine glycosylase
MLQQTRVETVIPYFHRFLERFPSAKELAGAETDEVMALWSGLGYYGRARRLQAAARAVEANGEFFPRTAAELAELPGVGPYTAAAVASIAFGEATPVLDGNAIRVVSRLDAYSGAATAARGRRRLLSVAASLLDAERPGDSNQALMELGATVCLPRAPRCGECPLATGCRAAAEGRPESYPRPRRRREIERQLLVAAVVERGGRYLLSRRPRESSLMAGTWEVPWVARKDGVEVEEALGGKYGGGWRLGERLGAVRHSITYRALEVEVHRADRSEEPAGRKALEKWPLEKWLAPGEIGATPVSSLVRKVLKLA